MVFLHSVLLLTKDVRSVMNCLKASVSSSGSQTSGKYPTLANSARTRASILSVLILAWAMVFVLIGFETITRAGELALSSRAMDVELVVTSSAAVSPVRNSRAIARKFSRVVAKRLRSEEHT